MTPSPTPASLVRNLLQEISGVLELSAEDEAFITLPRCYPETWIERLHRLLALVEPHS